MDHRTTNIPSPSVREPRLEPSSLLGRVAVAAPYLTLTDLARDRDALRACAVAQAPSYRELAPMTGAEMGRHAAIAGSLALAQAQADDKRRYYLAREADCRFLPSEAARGTPVELRAAVVRLDKREGTARVDLAVGHTPLATFEVSYAILQEATFRRLFQRHLRPDDASPSPSPYESLLAEAVTVEPERAYVEVLRVAPEGCAGHFPGYPALPVAVLMGELSYLAGLLMPGRFRVARGHVRASDLAWAGERVYFEARRDGRAPEGLRFRCHARAGEGSEAREVGAMELWLVPA